MHRPLRPPGLNYLDRLHVGGQILYDDPPNPPTIPPVTPPVTPPAEDEGLGGLFNGGGNARVPLKVIGELTQAAAGIAGPNPTPTRMAAAWEQIAYRVAEDAHNSRVKLRDAANAPAGATVIADKAEQDALSAGKSTYGSIKKLVDRAKRADELEALETQRATTETAKKALTDAGLNADAALNLPGMKDHTYETTTVKGADNVEIKQVMATIKKADGSTEKIEVKALIDREHAWAKPSLVPAPDANGGGPAPDTSGSGNGLPWGQQGQHGGPTANPTGQPGFSVPAIAPVVHATVQGAGNGGGQNGQQGDFVDQILAPFAPQPPQQQRPPGT